MHIIYVIFKSSCRIWMNISFFEMISFNFFYTKIINIHVDFKQSFIFFSYYDNMLIQTRCLLSKNVSIFYKKNVVWVICNRSKLIFGAQITKYSHKLCIINKWKGGEKKIYFQKWKSTHNGNYNMRKVSEKNKKMTTF